MATKKPQAAETGAEKVLLRVRIDPKRVPPFMDGNITRHRAGLLFYRAPMEVAVTPEQAATIEADPLLMVERLDSAS